MNQWIPMKGVIIVQTEYKIEKNIPLPPSKAKASKYPFDQMGVGDSFKVETDEPDKAISSIRGSAQKFKPARFTVRVTSDGNVRCWRVA